MKMRSSGLPLSKTYVAHLGESQPFTQKWFVQAQRHNWLHVRQTQVLGAGAPWIWNLAEEYFSGSQQTVDWYHVKQHLFAACCYTLHAEGTLSTQRWMNQQSERLFQGYVEGIAQTLRTAGE
jgi:hypothetical protein